MPLFLLIVAILFITAAIRGKQDLLFSTLKDDFTGPNNFIYWGIALFVIGAIGYYKPAKPFSNAFLTLIIIVLLLSNKGFFAQFMSQIKGTTVTPSNPNAAIWDFGSNRLVTPIQSRANDMINQSVNWVKSIFGV